MAKAAIGPQRPDLQGPIPGLSKLRKKQHREVRLGIAFASLLALSIAGLATWETLRTYGETLEAGRVRASNLALVLEEQTRRSVQAIDLTLSGIADRLRDAPETPSHDPAITGRFRAQLAELPYVRALFVIGSDGFLVQDSDVGTPKVSLADRDYFKVHVDNPSSGLYVGVPLKSRSTQIGSPWFLSVSRRITLPDGRFYGVAVAALEPRYFARFYENLAVGDGGVVALIHRSGMVIARVPDYERGIGVSLAGQALFTQELPKASSGTYTATSKVDGTERIYGYRGIAPLPLVVAVGLSRAVLLNEWRGPTILAAVVAGTLICLIILGTYLLLARRARDLAFAERMHDIERIESLGRITSSVAHDFNNFLTVIRGNLELLQERLTDGDRSKKQVSAALAAVDRSDHMVAQLLSIARRNPASVCSEDLCVTLGNMLDLLRPAARPCDIACHLPNAPLYCEVDRQEFERATMNLVVNARDAAKDGGRITISLERVPAEEFDSRKWPDLPRREYVACRVQDEGEGIAPEVLRRVFEPYFTTKPAGLGTGLGLSQVFGFARRSGGGVYIESAVGLGTNVAIVLPRAFPQVDLAAEFPTPIDRRRAARAGS